MKNKQGKNGNSLKKESLFARRLNEDSRVSMGPWTDSYVYIRGFKEAAQRLSKTCETILDRNTLVFPIVFNYRHYLELQLKLILNYLNSYVPLDKEGDSKNILESHNLHELWKEIKGLKGKLEQNDQRFVFDPKWDIKKVEQCIQDFHSVDARSFAFRYPTKRKTGEPSIPDLSHINIKNFLERMDEVAVILDDIDNKIAIAIDYRNENFE